MAIKMPLSLKMSATWELEKSSSSVVPRVLHLCLSRLVVVHAPDPDLTTLMIAIRMRETSRRILRSPELAVPGPAGGPAVICGTGGIGGPGGGVGTAGGGGGGSSTAAAGVDQLAIDLDLHFSVQYAHMLKRDTNILQILVQRRKKYKSKPMLGYKTLALCNINMAQVLQRRVTDRVIDLTLASPTKPHVPSTPTLFGHLHVDSLASLPLEVDPSVARKKPPGHTAGAAVATTGLAACGANSGGSGGLQAGTGEGTELVFSDLFSEDEDSEDFESCGPPGAIDHRGRQQKKFLRAMSTGQRHLKQKLAGFIKRFRVTEDEVLGVSEQEDLNRIWEEIEELETNSDGDSDVDFDTLSLQSTPRPNLRPFFHDSMASVSGKGVPTVSVNAVGGLLPGDESSANMVTSSFERDSSEEHSADGSTRATEHSRGKVQKRDSANLSRKGRSSERLSWRDKKSASTCKEPSSSASVTSGTAAATAAAAGVASPPAAGTGSASLSVEQTLPVDHFEVRREASPEPVRLVQYTALPNSEPHHETTEHVARLIDTKDAAVDCLVLLNRSEPQSKTVQEHLVQDGFKVIPIYSFADTRHAMSRLVLKLQKQGRISSRVQLVLLGSDAHISAVLRVYVEQLSSRPHDWQSHFRFYPILVHPSPSAGTNPAANSGPTCVSPTSVASAATAASSQLVHRLCHVDTRYAALFGDSTLSVEAARPATGTAPSNMPNSLAARLRNYLSQAQSCLHMPIGECMMSKGTEEENSEHFVPFLLGIRIGPAELLVSFPDVGDIPPPATTPVDGPPTSLESRVSPPGSPHLHGTAGKEEQTASPASSTPATTVAPSTNVANLSACPSGDPVELQIDYWTDNTDRKSSLKSSFRGLLVNLSGGIVSAGGELPASASALLSLLTLSKEKKQKLQIRLPGGRRPKETDLRRETNERITRLICTSGRGQANLMRVFVDGDPWSGVKFFQLSPSWQTHVKWFPIAVFATSHNNVSI